MANAPMYLVQAVAARNADGEVAKSILNPRRGSKPSVPNLSWASYLTAKEEILNRFDLGDYAKVVMGEMYARPIPHVFHESDTRALTSLYERRFPSVLEFVLRRLKPGLQTLNKESRLGWPWFDRPTSKRAWLMPYFEKILEGQRPKDLLQDAYTIMNVRLQPEPVDKVRDMMFVADDGSIKELKVDRAMRTVEIEGFGDFVAARTRLVFNLPWCNLYKQPLDTAIHKVFLHGGSYGHNLYSRSGYLPVLPNARALDVKHFERHTSACARARARIISGNYGEIGEAFSNIPFMVPSMSRKKVFFLRPNRDAGYSEQYASGDSAVAPIQKEIFQCLFTEFAVTHLRMSENEAFQWAYDGGSPDNIRIHNYGDDNLFSGDPGAIQALFDFLGKYLHVEEELPAKFLGFLWTGQDFRLGRNSYLLKTWLNEREPFSAFRKFPCFGWVEKRKVYSQYGLPDIHSEVFPAENEILAKHGLDWADLLISAAKEGLHMASYANAMKIPAWLLGKDYALTEEEKVSTGLYEGLYKEETTRIINNLLPPEWRKLLP